MTPLEKLLQARELLLEAEDQFIREKGFCPYELGFTLRKLDETINQIKNNLS